MQPQLRIATVDVLLVDDVPELLRMWQRFLVSRRLSVRTATSTFHAIRVLERWPVRVLVADYYMPGPSGARLIEACAKRWPGTRRVIMSGHVTSAIVDAVPLAHRVLDKSFTLQGIVEILVEEAKLAQP